MTRTRMACLGAIAASVVSAVLACSDGGGLTPERASLADTVVVDGVGAGFNAAVGDQLQLSATVKDSNGTPLDVVVQWSAQPSTVASVSSGGVITFLGPGSVSVTAAAGVAKTVLRFESYLEARVPPTGGSSAVTTSPDGVVQLNVPAGATNGARLLYRRSTVPIPTGGIAGTRVEVHSAADSFAVPLGIRVAFDSFRVAAVDRDRLRVYRVESESFRFVAGSGAEPTTSHVRGTLSRPGVYAAALPPSVKGVEMISERLPVRFISDTLVGGLRVMLRDGAGDPVPSTRVRLTSHGVGAYRGYPEYLRADSTGVVSVDSVFFADMPGRSTLAFRDSVTDEAFLTVDVDAVAPPGINILPAEYRSMLYGCTAMTLQPIVELSNRNGLDLAQLTLRFSWDPADYQFDALSGPYSPGWRDDNGQAAAYTFDTARSAEGVVDLSGAVPGPTTSTFRVGVLDLTFKRTSQIHRPIHLEVLRALNAAGEDVTVNPIRSYGIATDCTASGSAGGTNEDDTFVTK